MTTKARHIFLQECKTKMFLAQDNHWTSDLARARDFETTVKAVNHAIGHRLAGAQILIRFGTDGLHDVTVPISCHTPARH